MSVPVLLASRPLLLMTLFLLLPGVALCRAGSEAARVAAILGVHASAARGQTLFVRCESCHGSDGRGEATGAVPAIAGQYRRVIVQQLLAFRQGRRYDPNMERVVDSHGLTTNQAIADVAAYVSTLPRAPALQVGDGRLLSHGAETFARLCSGCHGRDAQGSATQGIPWLASQQYGYLRTEMYYVIDHRRPNMAATHWPLFRRFDEAEFDAIPDWLSRLPPRMPAMNAGGTRAPGLRTNQ